MKIRPAFPPAFSLGLLFGLGVSSPPALAQTAPAPQPRADEAEEVLHMDVFDVTTSRDVDYLSQNAESATRLNVPIADIPQNILVFNQEFLADIMAATLEDVVLFDPTANSFGENDNISIRGQGAGVAYFNGFEQSAGLGSQTLVNVARTEIIKGPNAVLYGTGAFGGIINRVSKKPVPRAFTNLNASVDSHGYRRFSVDDNLPRVPQKLNLRLNASLSDGTRWGDRPRYDETVSLAASWAIARRTTLMAELTHQMERGVANWEFPVFGGNPVRTVLNPGAPDQVAYPLDIRRFSGERALDSRKITRRILYVDFRHEFSRHLIFRSMLNTESKKSDIHETFPACSDLRWLFGRVLMSRYYRNLWEDRDNYRMRNELVALFQTWGWDHKIIVGQSWFALRTKTLQYNTNTSLASYADSPSADRFPALDLVTGERVNLLTGEVMAAPPEIVYRANPAVDRTQRAGTRSYYANDLVTLVPGRLIVQAGVRYIENIWKVDNRAEPEDSYARVPEDDITHSLGVVWHLTPNKAWTLYANRTEAFQPNIQMDHAADDSEPVPLKSQTGIQYEAGVKYVWRDKFTSLLSWYDIMQNNVAASYAAYTPLPEGGMSSVRTRWRTIDGIHSRGFEAGFNWRASPALSVFGGYAYTHTVNEDKETGGGRHYRVPLHAVSLFGRYAVKRGPLAGLSFNCGFVWRDITLPQDRGGDPAQRPMWTVPPYLSIDLGATYAVKLSKKVRATLSARAANITDHLNYLNTNNLYTSITAPRTFTLGAGLSF